MKYVSAWMLAFVLMISGAVDAQTTAQREIRPSGVACMFDAERPEMPDCIIAGSRTLSVNSKYLGDLPFDRFGLAPVYAREYGWTYVNRTGLVVITGVYGFDNWADEFHDGLVRIRRGQKFGFANRKGVVVIPPNYDGAFSFKGGLAVVCRHCRCKQTGEHCLLTGGDWSRINKSGHIVSHIDTGKP
jgi:hypothetical protein